LLGKNQYGDTFLELETNPKYGKEREIKLAKIVRYFNSLDDESDTCLIFFSHHKKPLEDYLQNMIDGVPDWIFNRALQFPQWTKLGEKLKLNEAHIEKIRFEFLEEDPRIRM
jgi:hypothetical protein